MSPRLIIQSITGSTPFEFYVCDIAESICYYLGSISSTSTSYFTLPSIFTTAPIIRLKMIDANGCEIKKDLSCDFTCGFDLIIEAVDCTFCIVFETTTQPTSTPTQTPTVTITVTPTITPSNTPSPTNTSTPTPSATFGITPTSTPTETPTSTPSETPTSTPSETPTSTPTETPTSTPTETPTNTPTETPTNTPTNTLTPTTTETPTNTPTETPTNTPTVTPTPTQAIVPSDPTLEIYYQGQVASNFTPTPSSGSTFNQWSDSSASAHNANPIGGGSGPAPEWWSNVQNGLGGVYFNGTSDGLSVNPLTDLSNKSGQTIVLVAKTLNTGTTQQYIQGGEDGNTGLNATYIRQSGGTYNLAIAGGFATGGSVNNSPHILSLVFNGGGVTNSDKLKFYIDNSLQSLTFTQNIGTLTSSIIDYIFLGVSYTSAPAGVAQFYYNGFLFDVLAYSRTLTSGELSTLHTYLSNKWNIPIS